MPYNIEVATRKRESKRGQVASVKHSESISVYNTQTNEIVAYCGSMRNARLVSAGLHLVEMEREDIRAFIDRMVNEGIGFDQATKAGDRETEHIEK